MSRRLILLAFVFLLLGCERGTTETGILQGANTSAYVGSYKGVFSVAITVEAGNYGPKKFSSLPTTTLRVYEAGLAEFVLGGFVIPGIVSDNGQWQVDLGVNDLGNFIDSASKDTLRQVGCPLDKRFARLSGQINPPSLSGQVADKLSCRVLMVPVGSIDISGAVQAAR
ncbi:MAG: hypothetical protein CL398_12600 [Acidiferrobacteraceae bacterium]|nr:hypothetical protein [Acidiferrobacteraceae bacterium]